MFTDVIAPPALSFQARNTIFGDQMGRVMVITDYPPRVEEAWLDRLAHMSGVTLSIQMQPTDPLELLKTINRSVQEYTNRISQGGTALMMQRWQQSVNDAKALLAKVDQEAQKVYRVAVIILVLAADEPELNRRCREVEAACAACGMRARTAVFGQEQGLKANGPWAVLPQETSEMAAREMPAETIAASYPWVASGINHGRGLVLGRDTQDGLVLMDRWQAPAGTGITNPNINILGASGSGKSFAAKVWLLREFALGARVLVLDPEREWRGICRALNGDWINAAGGDGRINPLQVLPAPDIPDDEDDEEARGPLAAHIQRVKTFFELYLPLMNDLEQALLQEAILGAYTKYGVSWNTDPTKISSWPIIQDVQTQVREQSQNYTDAALRLDLLLKSAVEGADSSLWNGQTTIKHTGPGAGFTVLDIRDLTDASDNVRRAQYFNILTYAWHLVRQGRATGQRTILAVDEAWLLADPNTPQALGFLRDLSKRIRKYNGSLVVITQNIGDFLAPELERMGAPVLANASSKLLMRQETKDLEAVSRVLRLSDAETDLLSQANRGEGLLVAGNERVHINIEGASHEIELINAA